MNINALGIILVSFITLAVASCSDPAKIEHVNSNGEVHSFRINSEDGISWATDYLAKEEIRDITLSDLTDRFGDIFIGFAGDAYIVDAMQYGDRRYLDRPAIGRFNPRNNFEVAYYLDNHDQSSLVRRPIIVISPKEISNVDLVYPVISKRG